ncbi:hypothetical protein PAPYR_9952 [Paratrimastix pyriformis]|uniref:Non-specific serine/threonine protein kinase n=1 Tax=Paratrimastix pyriformis TaxID=342808 RepID=A0ABQ8U733_9EUKA|nr:hypothetical protein PAPYR_9952 [Paratrimastix pyriformis]
MLSSPRQTRVQASRGTLIPITQPFHPPPTPQSRSLAELLGCLKAITVVTDPKRPAPCAWDHPATMQALLGGPMVDPPEVPPSADMSMKMPLSWACLMSTTNEFCVPGPIRLFAASTRVPRPGRQHRLRPEQLFLPPILHALSQASANGAIWGPLFALARRALFRLEMGGGLAPAAAPTGHRHEGPAPPRPFVELLNWIHQVTHYLWAVLPRQAPDCPADVRRGEGDCHRPGAAVQAADFLEQLTRFMASLGPLPLPGLARGTAQSPWGDLYATSRLLLLHASLQWAAQLAWCTRGPPAPSSADSSSGRTGLEGRAREAVGQLGRTAMRHALGDILRLRQLGHEVTSVSQPAAPVGRALGLLWESLIACADAYGDRGCEPAWPARAVRADGVDGASRPSGGHGGLLCPCCMLALRRDPPIVLSSLLPSASLPTHPPASATSYQPHQQLPFLRPLPTVPPPPTTGGDEEDLLWCLLGDWLLEAPSVPLPDRPLGALGHDDAGAAAAAGQMAEWSSGGTGGSAREEGLGFGGKADEALRADDLLELGWHLLFELGPLHVRTGARVQPVAAWNLVLHLLRDSPLRTAVPLKGRCDPAIPTAFGTLPPVCRYMIECAWRLRGLLSAWPATPPIGLLAPCLALLHRAGGLVRMAALWTCPAPLPGQPDPLAPVRLLCLGGPPLVERIARQLGVAAEEPAGDDAAAFENRGSPGPPFLCCCRSIHEQTEVWFMHSPPMYVLATRVRSALGLPSPGRIPALPFSPSTREWEGLWAEQVADLLAALAVRLPRTAHGSFCSSLSFAVPLPSPPPGKASAASAGSPLSPPASHLEPPALCLALATLLATCFGPAEEEPSKADADEEAVEAQGAWALAAQKISGLCDFGALTGPDNAPMRRALLSSLLAAGHRATRPAAQSLPGADLSPVIVPLTAWLAVLAAESQPPAAPGGHRRKRGVAPPDEGPALSRGLLEAALRQVTHWVGGWPAWAVAHGAERLLGDWMEPVFPEGHISTKSKAEAMTKFEPLEETPSAGAPLWVCLGLRTRCPPWHCNSYQLNWTTRHKLGGKLHSFNLHCKTTMDKQRPLPEPRPPALPHGGPPCECLCQHCCRNRAMYLLPAVPTLQQLQAAPAPATATATAPPVKATAPAASPPATSSRFRRAPCGDLSYAAALLRLPLSLTGATGAVSGAEAGEGARRAVLESYWAEMSKAVGPGAQKLLLGMFLGSPAVPPDSILPPDRLASSEALLTADLRAGAPQRGDLPARGSREAALLGAAVGLTARWMGLATALGRKSWTHWHEIFGPLSTNAQRTMTAPIRAALSRLWCCLLDSDPAAAEAAPVGYVSLWLCDLLDVCAVSAPPLPRPQPPLHGWIEQAPGFVDLTGPEEQGESSLLQRPQFDEASRRRIGLGVRLARLPSLKPLMPALALRERLTAPIPLFVAMLRALVDATLTQWRPWSCVALARLPSVPLAPSGGSDNTPGAAYAWLVPTCSWAPAPLDLAQVWGRLTACILQLLREAPPVGPARDALTTASAGLLLSTSALHPECARLVRLGGCAALCPTAGRPAPTLDPTLRALDAAWAALLPGCFGGPLDGSGGAEGAASAARHLAAVWLAVGLRCALAGREDAALLDGAVGLAGSLFDRWADLAGHQPQGVGAATGAGLLAEAGRWGFQVDGSALEFDGPPTDANGGGDVQGPHTWRQAAFSQPDSPSARLLRALVCAMVGTAEGPLAPLLPLDWAPAPHWTVETPARAGVPHGAATGSWKLALAPCPRHVSASSQTPCPDPLCLLARRPDAPASLRPHALLHALTRPLRSHALRTWLLPEVTAAARDLATGAPTGRLLDGAHSQADLVRVVRRSAGLAHVACALLTAGVPALGPVIVTTVGGDGDREQSPPPVRPALLPALPPPPRPCALDFSLVELIGPPLASLTLGWSSLVGPLFQAHVLPLALHGSLSPGYHSLARALVDALWALAPLAQPDLWTAACRLDPDLARHLYAYHPAPGSAPHAAVRLVTEIVEAALGVLIRISAWCALHWGHGATDPSARAFERPVGPCPHCPVVAEIMESWGHTAAQNREDARWAMQELCGVRAPALSKTQMDLVEICLRLATGLGELPCCRPLLDEARPFLGRAQRLLEDLAETRSLIPEFGHQIALLAVQLRPLGDADRHHARSIVSQASRSGHLKLRDSWTDVPPAPSNLSEREEHFDLRGTR